MDGSLPSRSHAYLATRRPPSYMVAGWQTFDKNESLLATLKALFSILKAPWWTCLRDIYEPVSGRGHRVGQIFFFFFFILVCCFTVLICEIKYIFEKLNTFAKFDTF